MVNLYIDSRRTLSTNLTEESSNRRVRKSRFLYERKPFCLIEKAVLSHRESRFLSVSHRVGHFEAYNTYVAIVENKFGDFKSYVYFCSVFKNNNKYGS